jgi:hypothetical protein
MKPIRATLLLAGLAGLLAAGAVAATPAQTAGEPIASAAGGDVVNLQFPALVNTRIARVQNLLASAAESEDMGDQATAVKALTALRSNLTKAWTGAKYVIANAPPPPPPGDYHVARAAGGAIAGASPYADQFATAAAVLSLQHTVATSAIAMMDNATTPLLAALNTTMFAALNARDTAIAYIHSLPVPATPAGIRVPARAGGGAIVGGWATTMQPLLFDVDDELQQADGVRALVNLSPSRKRLLDLVELQGTKTSRNINTYWPPLPAGSG